VRRTATTVGARLPRLRCLDLVLGDSTGHLREAHRALATSKTPSTSSMDVPLYWVNQDYSYNWSKEATRERLLESYRNTCKLHEQIGFEEI